jgi:hypothetical protein
MRSLTYLIPLLVRDTVVILLRHCHESLAVLMRFGPMRDEWLKCFRGGE